MLLLSHCHASNVSLRETIILANVIDSLAVMPQGGRPSPGAVLRAVTAAAEARAKGVTKKKSPTGESAATTPPPQTPVPPLSPKLKTWKAPDPARPAASLTRERRSSELLFICVDLRVY